MILPIDLILMMKMLLLISLKMIKIEDPKNPLFNLMNTINKLMPLLTNGMDILTINPNLIMEVLLISNGLKNLLINGLMVESKIFQLLLKLMTLKLIMMDHMELPQFPEED
jgi:hypothetical protein